MASDRPHRDDLVTIRAWLAAEGEDACDLTALEGDVSVRQYFRAVLDSGDRAIVACYPVEVRAACAKFLATSSMLTAVGVRVPAILADDCERGLMLIEDVGVSTLYDLRDRPWSHLARYFRRATEYLPRIRSLSPDSVASLNPPLDRNLLWRELKQTWQLFLEPRGLVGDAVLASDLRKLLEQICLQLGSEQPVPCHRDFMARNLVPVDPGEDLAVLDHQDMRLGPGFYDLASLLNDSLFPPATLEEELLARHLEGGADRLRYHRASAQRTLKAIGTYAAFSRRGHPRHESLIPPTLARALFHLRQLPEAAALASELKRRWQPLLVGAAAPRRAEDDLLDS